MTKRSYPKNITMNDDDTMNIFACSITHFNVNTNILSCRKKVTLNSHNPELESYYFIITYPDTVEYFIECWDSAELDYIAQEFLSRDFHVIV